MSTHYNREKKLIINDQKTKLTSTSKQPIFSLQRLTASTIDTFSFARLSLVQLTSKVLVPQRERNLGLVGGHFVASSVHGGECEARINPLGQVASDLLVHLQ
jgi:hypothetical protein